MVVAEASAGWIPSSHLRIITSAEVQADDRSEQQFILGDFVQPADKAQAQS